MNLDFVAISECKTRPGQPGSGLANRHQRESLGGNLSRAKDTLIVLSLNLGQPHRRAIKNILAEHEVFLLDGTQ